MASILVAEEVGMDTMCMATPKDLYMLLLQVPSGLVLSLSSLLSQNGG